MARLYLNSFILLVLLPYWVFAQGSREDRALMQTIRGQIIDQLLKTPIEGASVSLPGLNRNTISDKEGNFRFDAVPIGTRALTITHHSYQAIYLENLQVNAGKELVLQLPMNASYKEEAAVIVTARNLRSKPLNELSLVSARAFSVEETQRYAAAVNDPARMATSFAGVLTGDDGGNNIIIRGNAPGGLLWRMEGLDIPNPNHFASVGSSGGGISILSAQVLSTSDFMTAAFPAEYGNALSGVFDLSLRKGNDEKREYSAQLGVLGINLAAEGPFSKKNKGSYLVNYRYSTLQLLGKMGLDIGTGSTDFQDLSYHIYVPLGAKHQISLFGFNGSSGQHYDPQKDETKWESDLDRYSGVYSSRTRANGLTHQVQGGDNWTLKTGIIYAVSGNKYNEQYAETVDSLINSNQEKYSTRKWTANSVLNYKFNARHSLRAGMIFTRIGFDYLLNSPDHIGDPLEERININDHSYTLQGFAQWRWQAGKKWLLTGGLHYMEFLLNHSRSLEPRLAIRWEANKKNIFSFGYGLHSQLQPMGVYFAKTLAANNHWLYPNKKLGLTRAHHLVLSYTHAFDHGYRLRTEAYYQQLFNAPVSMYDTSSFSTLNLLQGFVTDPLTNRGKGKNYGLEISLEKQLRRNFYLLWSNAVYQSKYTAADGIERNTRFNGNYASTLTSGKEFVHASNKRSFGVNVKLIYMGGFRETPIDLAASVQKGYTVYREQEAYRLQLPAYYRADIRVSMKWNRKSHTSTLSLDLQNATNHLNRWGRGYDVYTGKVKDYYMTGIIPVLNYKIEF